MLAWRRGGKGVAANFSPSTHLSDDYSVLVRLLTILRTTAGSRYLDTLENPIRALLDDLDLGRPVRLLRK